jgi:hypothetical protein
MALTATVKRGEGLPDGQLQETWRLATLTNSGWVMNSAAVSSNATTVSYVTTYAIINGQIQQLAAATVAITGTLSSSTTSAFVWTLSVGGTVSNAIALSPGTLKNIAWPAIPASQAVLAITIVAATATNFNGGTNSLADASYTVSHFSFTGPTAIAMSTELFTIVPG